MVVIVGNRSRIFRNDSFINNFQEDFYRRCLNWIICIFYLYIISEYPLGQLPIMKVNGEVFCQEAAIHEFAAKRCRMGGKTPIEELKLDMLRGTFYEVFFIRIQN